ncbi:hypothetical protein P885DRAFT_43977 [Corynascus similis CBS 632.67]
MNNASYRTRRRPRVCASRLPNLALIAGLFLQPSHGSPAGAATIGRSPPASSFRTRDEKEHVVLADCIDTADVLSSQMAYFPGEVGQRPQDVAVVLTSRGQTALWVNANTTGLFTTTGVTFTALLGPRVGDGEFAGVGDNGYANFSCYQRYRKDLYQYGPTTCSQVYLCDHSDPPEGWVWDPNPTESSNSSMSQGTIIGIAVGVVGGVLFLIATALVFWYIRRSRRARQAAPSRVSSTLHEPSAPSAGAYSDAGDPKSPIQEQTQSEASTPGPVIQQMSAVYEMDGRHRIEMANDNGKVEMDAHGHGSAELDTAKDRKEAATPLISTESEDVSPLTPGLSDAPLQRGSGQPKSPPPQYAE